MIEFYVPKQTSKLVTLSRWTVCYVPLVLAFSKLSESDLFHHWWSLLLLLPLAIVCHWLATEGINRLLLKTAWGRGYLQRQLSWVVAQREYLKSRGEKGDNVYTDTGEFAATFMVGVALLLGVLCIVAFFSGEK
jgi:hypothetical protein